MMCIALAVGLSACPENDGDTLPVACGSEEITMHVRGEISAKPLANKSNNLPTILVAVHESYTIARCDSKTMSVVQPGRTLASARIDESGVVALAFARTIFRDEPAPPLSVTVLFDENQDGVCNGGELSGHAEVADDGVIGDLVDVHEGCPARL